MSNGGGGQGQLKVFWHEDRLLLPGQSFVSGVNEISRSMSQGVGLSISWAGAVVDQELELGQFPDPMCLTAIEHRG